MSQENKITGLILAGGAGRRVRGQDKGLLIWRGKRLIDHVAERFAPQTDELIVSCNRNVKAYDGIGDKRVQDNRPDFQGPLAGIEAAMAHVSGNILVVVACDAPLIPLDLVARLTKVIAIDGPGSVLIAYAHDGEREQYLSCAIHATLFPSLSAYLDAGNRTVRHWIQQHPSTKVDFSDQADAFKNFNSLEALSRSQTD